MGFPRRRVLGGLGPPAGSRLRAFIIQPPLFKISGILPRCEFLAIVGKVYIFPFPGWFLYWVLALTVLDGLTSPLGAARPGGTLPSSSVFFGVSIINPPLLVRFPRRGLHLLFHK